MAPELIAVLAVLALLVTLLIGVPVGYAMAFIGFAGLWIAGGFDIAMSVIQRVPFSSVVVFSLVVIPLFILMGEMATAAGVAERTFGGLRVIGGRMRASLGMAAVAACGAFGAASGSSIATAITIGGPALEEMKRHGYDRRLALGIVAGAGTLGALMPPSVVLIIYSLIADVSIAEAFLAGVVPALLTVVSYLMVLLAVSIWRPDWVPRTSPTSFRTKTRALKDLLPVAILALIVIGTLYTGIVSLSETAAMGAFAALGAWIVMRRDRLSWSQLKESTLSAVRTSSMLAMILIGAFTFTALLAFTRLPQVIAERVVDMDLSRPMFIGMCLILFLVLGLFLETTAMMLLTVPFLLPSVAAAGIDAVWFGIFFVKVVEVALVTPPIGLNAYVIKGLDDSASLRDVFQGASLFILADVLVIVAIAIWPPIVTGLPEFVTR